MIQTTTTVVRETYPAGAFVAWVVNTIIGVIELALVIRIILELFAASPASQFVSWIYGVTQSLLGPFAGAFSNLALGNGAQLDLVAILAMIVYALLGWVIIEALALIFTSAATVR
jgi:uncharacterized protein YggT (Ycf19 family)